MARQLRVFARGCTPLLERLILESESRRMWQMSRAGRDEGQRSPGLVVAGFVLPEEWEDVVAVSRWTAHREDPRVEPEIVEAVFGEAPDSSWRFYAFDEVVGMTADWHEEEDPAWFGVEPEAIAPAMSVLIGELGYDRPFALDYRMHVPCVRFMKIDGRWPVVATSLTDLMERLEGG